MLLTPRRSRPTPEELAAQMLAQKPDAILQAARQSDRARMAAAETSPVAGGVRVGPRPVEEVPPGAPRPRGVIKISPRINPTPPASSAPLDPAPMTSPVPVLTSPSAATVPPTYNPPPPGSVEEAQAQVDEASGRVVKDKNGKLMSILKMALQGAGQNFQGGRTARNWQELAGGIGGGVAGAITGAVKDDSDEQMQKEIDITHRQGELERRTKNEATRANIKFRTAQADLNAARPGLERDKIALKREYDEWRMRSGDRKQDSAESFIEWKKQNGDRRAETAEGRLELEREYRTVIQPEQFDRTLDQREDHFTRRQSQQQRQFDQTFGLNVDKYIERQRHDLVGEAHKSFEIATKGRVERLKALHSEIERWQKRKAEGSTRAGAANENISDLQAEALLIAGQIEAAREMALSGAAAASPRTPAPSLAPPVRRNVPGASTSRRPAAAPSSSVPVVDEQAIRVKAIEQGLDPEIAVQRARARQMLK